MNVMGFDPSKTSGISLWDTKRDHSSIWCDIIRMPDECDHYWFGVQIQRKILRIIKEQGKPDLGVVEQQSLNSMGNNLDGVIYPWGATQAFCGVLGVYGIPVVRIAPQSWHVPFFGRGFKPQFKVHKLKKPDPRTGKMERIEYLWKEACVKACEDMGIQLPKPASLAHNAADACALAICWRTGKPISEEYHPKFIELIQQRNERAPSGDLFAGVGA
jgi:hypothetical protein